MSDLLRRCCCGCSSGPLKVCIIPSEKALISSGEPGSSSLKNNDPRGEAYTSDQFYSGGGLKNLLQPLDSDNGGSGGLGEISIVPYDTTTDNLVNPSNDLKKIKDSCIIFLGWGMGIASSSYGPFSNESERKELFSFPQNIPGDTSSLPDPTEFPYLNAIATAVVKNGALLVVIGTATVEDIVWESNPCEFPDSIGNMQDAVVQGYMNNFLSYLKHLSTNYGGVDSGHSAISCVGNTDKPGDDSYGREWNITLNAFNTADLSPPSCTCVCSFFDPPSCWGNTSWSQAYGAFETDPDIIAPQLVDGATEEQPYFTFELGCELSGGLSLSQDTSVIKVDKIGKGYLMVGGSPSSFWGPLDGETQNGLLNTGICCFSFCCDQGDLCCPDNNETFWERGFVPETGVWLSRLYGNNIWFIRFIEQYLRTGQELPSP